MQRVIWASLVVLVLCTRVESSRTLHPRGAPHASRRRSAAATPAALRTASPPASAQPPLGVARRLQQQPYSTCPPGCDIAGGGCAFSGTYGGYLCRQCLGSLVSSPSDGTCGCPAGWYASAETVCSECGTGWWCPGGAYAGALSPNRTACGALLTTLNTRGASARACVNTPGTSLGIGDGGVPVATPCPVDTYSSGLRRQRACVPCGQGYTTNGTTGQTSRSACALRAGYFATGPGEVALCPRGWYKAGQGMSTTCTACAAGVTTTGIGSTSEAACSVVSPGYYPEVVSDGIVKSAQLCPQKFVCAGGSATAAFNVSTPAADVGTNTVAVCPDGSWTQGIGATDASQCLTPPGYKTSGGVTTACDDGGYRAQWVVPSQATTCDSCGQGIRSAALQNITAYAITPDAAPTVTYVRASPAACYIAAGQGMYYSPASKTFAGVNCGDGSYGVSNTSYGLSRQRPCRACGFGLQTSLDLPSSAQYWASSGGTQGFTSPLACVTRAGFGYDGTRASRCPLGSWNPAGTRGNCTACGEGLSTPDSPDAQVAAANCTLTLPGYGYLSGSVQACPVGTFNDALQPNTTTPCTACSTGFITAGTGSNSSAACNLCAAGYGGTSGCSTQCGGTNGANYATGGQPNGTACSACPAVTPALAFTYAAVAQPFTPDAVARTGAAGASDCLAEFAQIGGDPWYLGGTATLTNVSAATAFDSCVANCQADADCQYVTYDYAASSGDQCYKKTKGSTGSDVIAFKAVLASNTSAAASAFTFWTGDATGIGADTSASGSTASVQACLNDCTAAPDCAAVVMTGLSSGSSLSSAPSTCSLVKGDGTLTGTKRSAVKAVASRLSLAAAFS